MKTIKLLLCYVTHDIPVIRGVYTSVAPRVYLCLRLTNKLYAVIRGDLVYSGS